MHILRQQSPWIFGFWLKSAPAVDTRSGWKYPAGFCLFSTFLSLISRQYLKKNLTNRLGSAIHVVNRKAYKIRIVAAIFVVIDFVVAEFIFAQFEIFIFDFVFLFIPTDFENFRAIVG